MEPRLTFAPILTPLAGGGIAWYPTGALATDEQGRISYAGPRSGLPPVLQSLPARTTDNILLPGFVDCHTHLAQYRCRGRYAEGLLPWLQHHIYPEELRFADTGYARGLAREFCAALAQAGTTTAAVYTATSTASTDVAFEEAERAGLRVFMGRMMMDRHGPQGLLQPVDDIIRETESLLTAWHGKSPLLQYALAPRFALACSPRLLQATGELAAAYDVYVQTHLNEQPEEIRATMQAFRGYGSYTEIYARAGLLGERTILGHSVHTSPDELATIAEAGASVAHCPDANLFLGSGRFDIEAHAEKGISVGLGSDVGAGTSVSMLHIIRSMAHVQGRALPPALPLHAATLCGAEALGIAAHTGSLEAGKSADYIEIAVDESILGARTTNDLTAEEAASFIVYAVPEPAIAATVVAGNPVYRNN